MEIYSTLKVVAAFVRGLGNQEKHWNLHLNLDILFLLCVTLLLNKGTGWTWPW